MNRESGDQNGASGSSVPASGRLVGESRRLTHSIVFPPAAEATNVTCRPSGDTARLADAGLKLSLSGGRIDAYSTRGSVPPLAYRAATKAPAAKAARTVESKTAGRIHNFGRGRVDGSADAPTPLNVRSAIHVSSSTRSRAV